MQTQPCYVGPYVTLGDVLVDDAQVPDEFFIPTEQVASWEYYKGGKSEKRVNKTTGFEYNYSEGAMAFPDSVDKPSRTIITGEGGAAPSRFKHVVLTPSGRYRRLVPLELERLNMFPDNHTAGASDARRAFLMGNALVTGIVERIALQLLQYI
jgi:DNA (cytosine-5)-methyltransferase 1